MSQQRVVQILGELKKLKRQTKDKRSKFIKTCKKDTIHGICECIRNVINGNVKLTDCHLKKLKRHEKSLRKLALKKTSLTQRKKILQKGGFIQLLLPPLITGLTSLLGNLLYPSRNAER